MYRVPVPLSHALNNDQLPHLWAALRTLKRRGGDFCSRTSLVPPDGALPISKTKEQLGVGGLGRNGGKRNSAHA